MGPRPKQTGPLPFGDEQLLVLNLADDAPPRGKVLAQIPLCLSDVQLARDDAWWRGVRRPVGARSRRLPGAVSSRPRDGLLAQWLHDSICGRPAGLRAAFRRDHSGLLGSAEILELVEARMATADEGYRFYLTVAPADVAGSASPGTMPATMRREPLGFESASLAEVMAASEPLPGASPPPPDEPGLAPDAGLRGRGGLDRRPAAGLSGWRGRVGGVIQRPAISRLAVLRSVRPLGSLSGGAGHGAGQVLGGVHRRNLGPCSAFARPAAPTSRPASRDDRGFGASPPVASQPG